VGKKEQFIVIMSHIPMDFAVLDGLLTQISTHVLYVTMSLASSFGNTIVDRVGIFCVMIVAITLLSLKR
jgi:hypothetical protein